MAKLQDLPALIGEFWNLSKEYLLQETVGHAKKLGRFTGFSLGAAVLWSTALLLIGIAVMRGVVDALPDGAYWEALGYVIAFLAFALLAVALIKAGPSSNRDEMADSNGGTP